MNIMAVTYSAKATITLESQDSYESCQMIIGESNELVAGLNNGEYAEINMDGRSVALYVEYDGVKYQHFASNPATMKNLTLGAMTDNATSYNLIISDVTGSFTLKLGDAEPVAIAAGTTVISLTPGQTAAIGIINYDPALASVTTNAHGLATFSFNQNVVAAEAGVKLYRGKVSGETLALTEVDFVEANQGVIVYGEVNHTYPFIAGAGTADFTENELLAASSWSASHDGYDIYVLSGNALYLYEGTDFPANKAFLKIAQSANPSPRRIRLVFDQATAIDNISADNVKAEKVVENGQILIRRGNEVYNLQGQIVK